MVKKAYQFLLCMHLTTESQTIWGKKMIELQGEIDESTIIVGDFTPLYQKWRYPAARK